MPAVQHHSELKPVRPKPVRTQSRISIEDLVKRAEASVDRGDVKLVSDHAPRQKRSRPSALREPAASQGRGATIPRATPPGLQRVRSHSPETRALKSQIRLRRQVEADLETSKPKRIVFGACAAVTLLAALFLVWESTTSGWAEQHRLMRQKVARHETAVLVRQIAELQQQADALAQRADVQSQYASDLRNSPTAADDALAAAEGKANAAVADYNRLSGEMTLLQRKVRKLGAEIVSLQIQ